MITTIHYCGGPDEVCVRCGAPLVAPNQICHGPAVNLDEAVDLDDGLTRSEWRLMWQCLKPRQLYMEQRASRRRDLPEGADAVNAKFIARMLSLTDLVASNTTIGPNDHAPLDAKITRREWRVVLEALERSRINYNERLDRLTSIVARATGEE